MFPKHLPGTAKVQAEKVSETHNDGSEALVQTKNIGKSFKDFPVALLVYYNCSCIGKPKNESGSEDLFDAIPGKCPKQCKILPFFLTFFFFTVVFTFMAVTPTTVAILRCVPDKQRSFALGVQLVFLRLLGTIPGPILFGIAIDGSCTLWAIDECEIKGACWVYDNKRMAYLLLGMSAACKIITIIFVVLAVYFYKPPAPNKALSQQDAEMASTVST
ncbi:hypothetical protein WISP_34648 [Willisornis vidua]|uniref:Solute carrier organic anion transporter family member 4C1 n=1 Tax=Willisornis vidua TaxID=1566151 RepID=A0ABQ9DQ69_9PASS|nr:hypothetical protein WISP_34648 [Willisornis vidua]